MNEKKQYLDVRFDVTDLSEDEVDALTGEVVVQGESSDGHGEAPVVSSDVVSDEPSTIVIVMRDPDASNEYREFGRPVVETIDIDFGYADLRDREEFDDWAESHLDTAKRLDEGGTDARREAATFIRSVVAEACVNYGHDEVD